MEKEAMKQEWGGEKVREMREEKAVEGQWQGSAVKWKWMLQKEGI